jgi:hypothetical protein
VESGSWKLIGINNSVTAFGLGVRCKIPGRTGLFPNIGPTMFYNVLLCDVL